MNLLFVFALLLVTSPLLAADGVLREESESEQALAEAKRREDQLVEALYDAHDRVRQLQQEDLRAPSPTDGKIVNGVPTSNFPTVGALLRGPSLDKLSAWCTGTLVGCTTFVTAGHCVRSSTNDRKPIRAEEYGQLRVFLQHAGMFEVAGVESHRDYAPPYADVAVITLKQPVDRIVPTPLNTAVNVRNGAAGTIAGFGRTGGTRADHGIKNFGAIRTATCQLRAQSDAVVCWRFNTVGAAPGTHSNTCNGDSGGPLFIDSADSVPKPLLAGITSTGDRRDCLYGDESYDVDVKTFASWIVEHAKEPLDGKACGSSPNWGALAAC